MGATASPSEADKPVSNKINTFRALPTPLTPAEVQDVFPPMILSFMAEAFSVRLSPELPELNFLLCFMGLASTNS
jgi:hypothetical protein